MERKRLHVTSEQTLRLEQLRQALSETLPAGMETEAYPTPQYATCGGSCFYACDGNCWTGCSAGCMWGCVNTCWAAGKS